MLAASFTPRLRSCHSYFSTAGTAIAVSLMALTAPLSASAQLGGLSLENLQALQKLTQQGNPNGGAGLPNTLQNNAENTASVQAHPSGAAQDKQGNKDNTPTPLSSIERDYNERLDLDTTKQPLRQFGYDSLAGGDTTGQGQQRPSGSVGPGYVLSFGDRLNIVFRGEQQSSQTVTIGNTGDIILPGIEPVVAAGLTMAELETQLNDKAAAKLGDTTVYLSLVSARARQVMVLGAVETPGRQQLSPFGGVIDALMAAGGVERTGSLRRIHILRGNKRQTVDLYNILMGTGSGPGDLALQDGDRLIVPPIGPTIAVVGDVARPAIYELPTVTSSISVSKLLAYAGGAIRPAGNRLIALELADGGEQAVDVSPKNSLRAGNVLEVQQQRKLRQQSISVVGHVSRPGTRALRTGDTLADAIGSADFLQEQAYLAFAALVRRTETVPVNLEGALNGTANIALKSGDELVVFSEADIQYLWSADVQSLLAGTPLARQAIAAADAEQTPQPNTMLATKPTPVNQQNLFIRQGDAEDPEAPAKIVKSCAGLSALQHVLQTTSGNSRGGRYRNIKEVLNQGSMTAITGQLQQYRPCPAILQTHGELLPLMLDHVVAIGGSVQVPGAYPVAGRAAVTDLLAVAGGLAYQADRDAITISRRVITNGLREEQRLDVSLDDLQATVTVQAGDSIMARAATEQASTGSIILKGQFQKPGRYEVREDETLSNVIARAGGLTTLAYPYGAVFTRESIATAERQSYQRVAQQMESSLLANLSQLETGQRDAGLILQAVNQMINRLKNAKAVGRLVVEADPAELLAKPTVDILLEPGDTLYVPKRPSYVMVSGDVLNPGAQQFDPDMTAEDYIELAGGMQRTADDDRLFVVLPDGAAKPISVSFWNFEDEKIPPGSTIVVPTDPIQVSWWRIIGQVGGIFNQLAISAASLSVIARDN